MKDSTDMIYKKIDTIHVEPSHKFVLLPPQRRKKTKKDGEEKKRTEEVLKTDFWDQKLKQLEKVNKK